MIHNLMKEPMMRRSQLAVALMLLGSTLAVAGEKIVVVNAISEEGVGKIIGTVKLSDSDQGLLIDPDLGELTPGPHGFHIHEKPSCGIGEKDGKKVAGLGAGGHYDPHKSAKHEGPEGHGHHGDLPALEVKEDGTATRIIVAPRLKLAEITGRSLMIHEGGDNYSDTPKPLGGGGGRIACGIIE
jgi:Cu-Zn family superoxide dismutase